MASRVEGFAGACGGSGFVMGVLAGTAVGAGLAMMLAPKPGSELRSQLSEQAGALANRASRVLRRASASANDAGAGALESASGFIGDTVAVPEPFNHPVLVIVEPERA